MTPERRAEIERHLEEYQRLYSVLPVGGTLEGDGALYVEDVRELLSEIDRYREIEYRAWILEDYWAVAEPGEKQIFAFCDALYRLRPDKMGQGWKFTTRPMSEWLDGLTPSEATRTD